jgi:hypothetical protein
MFRASSTSAITLQHSLRFSRTLAAQALYLFLSLRIEIYCRRSLSRRDGQGARFRILPQTHLTSFQHHASPWRALQKAKRNVCVA